MPAQDDADGRIVVGGAFLLGKIPHVHVHLPDVLVLHGVLLQVDEDEALEDAVVEDEINPVMDVVHRDWILAPDECEALAEFEQKRLEVVHEPLLEVAFGVTFRLRQAEEFERVGVLHDVLRLADNDPLPGQLENALLVPACRKPEEQPGIHLPAQGKDIPSLPHALFLVETAFQRIGNRDQLADLRPVQFVRNVLTIRVGEVKLAHVVEVGAAEAPAEFERKHVREVREQSGTVLGSCVAALLELHDVPADEPVGGNHGSVDVFGDGSTSFSHDLHDAVGESIQPLVGMNRQGSGFGGLLHIPLYSLSRMVGYSPPRLLTRRAWRLRCGCRSGCSRRRS